MIKKFFWIASSLSLLAKTWKNILFILLLFINVIACTSTQKAPVISLNGQREVKEDNHNLNINSQIGHNDIRQNDINSGMEIVTFKGESTLPKVESTITKREPTIPKVSSKPNTKKLTLEDKNKGKDLLLVKNEPKSNANEIHWLWPIKGPILRRFSEMTEMKGVDIGGKVGTLIKAAANGTVVYSGQGLKGYGKLIIIKHTENFLSAYAHNQELMVKEDERVKTGQVIAKMGNTDSNSVKLHFEIRYQGKPVDPLKYLP